MATNHDMPRLVIQEPDDDLQVGAHEYTEHEGAQSPRLKSAVKGSFVGSVTLSPFTYAWTVYEHSQTSISNTLHPGEDYASLARLLLSPYNQRLPPPKIKRQISDATPESGPNQFVILYRLHPSITPSGVPVKRFQELRPPCEWQSDTNVLLFLRGYPSPEWLSNLGSAYNVDPAFFHRHLDFLHAHRPGQPSTQITLPSACSNIFQLRIPSVGYRQGATRQRTHAYLETKRQESNASMSLYFRNLQLGGHQWKPGNSIVRRHWVHDESEFSIEQLASVYVATLDEAKGTWIGIVWLDSGDDLGSSPSGPWRADLHTYFRPVAQYRPRIALRAHQTKEAVESIYRRPDTISVPQSICLLSQCYGRSSITQLMAVDPFYALTELFEFTAASEAEFLGSVKNNLDDMDHLGEAADAHSSSAIAQSYLLYSRKILEHHMQNIEEALDFIKGRSSLKWPRSRDPSYQRKAENTSVRLQRDFEYLLRQADMLRGHCEREMSIMMNTAGIAEAKRGVEHSRRVFKFTLLASFYIPLSFTTSFFGMNFTQLGTGQLSIWVWAAVSLPIFGASILVLFWDPKMFRNWSTWVRNYLG